MGAVAGQASTYQNIYDVPHSQHPRLDSCQPILGTYRSINYKMLRSPATILTILLLCQRLPGFLLPIGDPFLECPVQSIDGFQVLICVLIFRTYLNIVDICGILPYKRMYPYKCGIKINFDILTTQRDQ